MTKDTIKTMGVCVSNWISSYRRDSSKHDLAKMDTDLRNLVNSAECQWLWEVCGCISCSEATWISCWWWLCHTVTDWICHRSGLFIIFYRNHERCQIECIGQQYWPWRIQQRLFCWHVISVQNQKTAYCYGPDKIVLDSMLLRYLSIYIKKLRPEVASSETNKVFDGFMGLALSSGQITRCTKSIWKKAGFTNLITATLLWKTAISMVHQSHPSMKDSLADIMCHQQDVLHCSEGENIS